MAASPTFTVDSSTIQNVVKMKGLPFKATSDDVIKFFQGFTLLSEQIYLKRHPDGRPNGEAFIVFENLDEARRATQKDRETFGDKFGDRYVRVYPTLDSDISDMQAAVVQQNMVNQQGAPHAHAHMDSVVKLKSLPFDATQLDIIQFFQQFKLKPNGVQLVVRSDNKPTGEAFVDFETPEEAAKAIREKDHKVFSMKFGDRYVRLIQVSRKEMQATLALRFGGEGILKVKGIPFKATATDVRKFFNGYKIKQEGISFIMHSDGRPTGMAFIEFETPQEAVKAMEKDRAKFGPEYGDRFCMLQLVGRHEMDKVVLQRENEQNKQMLGGLNPAQVAALTTQALMSPAMQPFLNPLLSFPVGLLPNGSALTAAQLSQLPGAGANAASILEANHASLAAQLNTQLTGITALSLLHHHQQQQQHHQQQQQQQQHHQQHQQQAQAAASQSQAANGGDMSPAWFPTVDPNTGMVVYQNSNTGERGWDPRLLASLNGLNHLATTQSPPPHPLMQQQSLGIPSVSKATLLSPAVTQQLASLVTQPLAMSMAMSRPPLTPDSHLSQLSSSLPIPVPGDRQHENGHSFGVGSVGSMPSVESYLDQHLQMAASR